MSDASCAKFVKPKGGRLKREESHLVMQALRSATPFELQTNLLLSMLQNARVRARKDRSMKITVETNALSPRDVAILLKISVRQANRIFCGDTLIKGRQVPTIKVGKLRRMRMATFEKYFSEV